MSARPECRQEERSGLWLFLVVALFAAAACFVIPSPSKYHGDEKFYTDAALQMTATGDYWTPQYSTGRIRLLKPIMAYWPIVASFKAFGVSLISSRLPAVVAGALSLLCVYWLGRVVFKSARIGLLATVLLASNIEFLTLSARATPDGLVTFFCAVSMLGFAIVWFGEGRWLTGSFLAWCGMGLAVQTKGLLGLAPLGANLLFLLLAKPEDWRQRASALTRLLPILAGLALATFWYIVMLKIHGVGAMGSFFNDQVGAKVSLNPGGIFLNSVTYFFAGVRHFLPWTLLLAVAAVLNRKEFMNFWARHRNTCVFLIVLFLLLVVGFSFGNQRRSRYMTVSYPALGLFFAATLYEFWNAPKLQKVVGRIMIGLGVVLIATSAALVVWGMQLSWRMAAASVALAAVGFAGVWLARKDDALGRWCWIGSLVLCFYALFDGAVRTVSRPSPLPAVAERLMRIDAPGHEIVTYEVDDSAAAVLRLNTHGKLQFRRFGTKDLLPPFPAILTTEAGASRIDLQERYQVERVSLSPESLRLRDALQKLSRREKTGGKTAEYFIGVPFKRDR